MKLCKFFLGLAVAALCRMARAQVPSSTGTVASGQDAEKHKDNYDYKPEDRDPDFDDNTQGYCDLGKETILAIDDLMETPTGSLAIWFDYYYEGGKRYSSPRQQIRGFIDLARQFIEDDEINESTKDSEILDAMTIKTVLPVEDTLTVDCRNKITSTLQTVNADFFSLMGVGKDPDERRHLTESLTDEAGRRLITTSVFPLFLNIFKDTGDTNDAYVRFLDTVRLRTDIIDVKQLLDGSFTAAVNSWLEAAATAKSFASKYAAFVVVDDKGGTPLLTSWLNGDFEMKYDNLFKETVDLCEMVVTPTVTPGNPTIAPTVMNPEIQDEFTPYLAVVDGETTSLVLDDEWDAFRKEYPVRPFCLLEVRGASKPLTIPTKMFSDSNVIIRKANRDNSMAFDQSDWFDLCNFYRLMTNDNNIRRLQSASDGMLVEDGMIVGFAIGQNLDEPSDDVRASKAFFLAKSAGTNIKTNKVPIGSDGNWIAPANMPLAFTYSPSRTPSVSPSLGPSVSPSLRPSAVPSSQPSAVPSTQPSAVPSSQPSASAVPSTQPSAVPSSQPSAVPSTQPSAVPSSRPSALLK